MNIRIHRDEHGYYDEDDDNDLDDAMRHFGLMANLHGYMAGGKGMGP